MEYRRLGKTDLSASAIGFGCSRIAQASSAEERRAVVSTLERALDRGINFFDTANAYDDCEVLLGSVFRRQRNRIILCSKAGYRSWLLLALDRWVNLPPRLMRRVIPQRKRSTGNRAGRRRRRNFEPRYITLAVEGSLRRLDTDHLDVFFLHSPPPEVVADDGVFETLERLKQKGCVRHYGISYAEGATTEHVLAALRRPGVSILQVMVNPLESVDLARIAPRAAELGVAIVGRQPFHRGAVFGAQRLAGLQAEHEKRTAAQTVLRSVLQLPGVDVALVGMRSTPHLEENLGAVSAPPLSADEMTRLYSGTRIR
jgi:aryl-alcohol dehydrogenase-like predicted oxidoreductase